MKKLILLVFVLTVMSCEKDEIYIEVPPVDVEISNNISDSVDLYGDSSLGLNIYLNSKDSDGRSCVSCHLSPTGIDIVQFGKIDIRQQDSIVVKRATGHITLEESYHIAAYLKTLNAQPNNNGSLSTMIGIDNSNGVEPSQVWDGTTSLTVNEINSWDFRNGISYDFEFPRWFKGDETNTMYDDNLDWLPETDLLTEKGIEYDDEYLNYIDNPTKENLKTLLIHSHYKLSEGERNPGEHGFNNFEKSFDYQRWMATLYMQHVIKPNSDLEFGEELSGYDLGNFSISDGIWDVGNIARRSQDNGSNVGNGDEVDNRLLNEVQWLYLGWLTNYGKRNSNESQYIGTALKDFGEEDLASLVILKSIVNRSPNSQRMYDDVFTMGYITSDDMFYESVKFGLDFLIDGANNNSDFTLLTNEGIQVTLGYLKNDDGNPSLKMFVENKGFLTQTEKTTLITKINTLYDLVDGM
jgi:hypothetical protein